MSRHEILIWSWSLDDDPPSGEALLTDEERERARRFVGPLLQRRFVAARSRLRALLGRHLGRDPRSLVFLLNEFGKPRLADLPGVQFSLSHSQDRALLAVSEGPEIGADLEMMRPVEHLDLARRYFHPDEVAAIERHDDPREAFFRIWTLKEAVVKAIGLGLSLPLDGFVVSIGGPRPVMAIAPAEAPGAWWLHLEPGSYCRALAMPVGGEVGLIHRSV
ncbi:MAG: 4'-phosphopantetheinyl transferase superfamily protein [Reyranella sp.]|nr:MAG: 4'-phosphopantetheinyl transferase superfamily protein [Reyranella sp.]